MNNFPLVTVNILSFNRRDELRNTLTKVFDQDYKNIEVIVVDNTSTDGTQEMVEDEFPNVKLIKLNENIGIAGWNEGFKVAKGEYILVLDDDAYPKNDTIYLAVNRMKTDSICGCIAINVINNNPENQNYRTHWLPDKHINETEWPIFVGCAVFLRKSLNISMPKDYFIYQHEIPVAADIYNKNYKIWYESEIICLHHFKFGSVQQERNEFYFFRNNLKFIFGYLPTIFTFYYASKLILFYFFKSIKKKWFKIFFKILADFHYEANVKISFRYFLKLRKLELFHVHILGRVFN